MRCHVARAPLGCVPPRRRSVPEVLRQGRVFWLRTRSQKYYFYMYVTQVSWQPATKNSASFEQQDRFLHTRHEMIGAGSSCAEEEGGRGEDGHSGGGRGGPAGYVLRRRRGDHVALAEEPREDFLSVIERAAGLFGLMVSEPKTKIMCLLKGRWRARLRSAPATRGTDGPSLDGPSTLTGRWTKKSRAAPVEHGNAFAGVAKRCTNGGASTSGSRCNFSRPKCGDAPYGCAS